MLNNSVTFCNGFDSGLVSVGRKGYGKIFNNANLKDLFKKNRMIVTQKVHKIVM
ncbi:MAG: hypothetical protein WBF68_05345 [Atribacterota bacterium]